MDECVIDREQRKKEIINGIDKHFMSVLFRLLMPQESGMKELNNITGREEAAFTRKLGIMIDMVMEQENGKPLDKDSLTEAMTSMAVRMAKIEKTISKSRGTPGNGYKM